MQISYNNFGAQCREMLGTLIGAEDEGPHRQLSSDQLSDGKVAGCSMSSPRACDQKLCNSVLCHECLRRVVWFCGLSVVMALL